ncbi:histidine kinase [Vallitalea longa]|uniref:Histidine kinase n=1 Tax=Vallitalea longa TaxID=2936439 RepID=A0A9W5YHF3_9FIRM|nr:histidine kinase [Vallitalea longa]GKX31989.1 histidine kinase [Vallitalea longa]
MKLKRKIGDTFKLTLFTKIVFVTLCSLIISTILVATVTISTGEKLYINTYNTSNQKIGDRIVDELENLNYRAYNLMEEYSQNNNLKVYCTEHLPSSEIFYKKYSLQNELQRINYNYGMTMFNIFVIGNNFNYYTDNYIGVTSKTKEKIMSMDFYQLYKKNPSNTYHYISSGFNGYASSEPSIVITKGLVDPIDNTFFGDMFISITEENYSTLYKKYMVRGNDVIILSKTGRVLSGSMKNYIGKDCDDILLMVKESIKSSKYVRTQFNEKPYLLTARYLQDMDFYLVILSDTSIVSKVYLESTHRIILLAIIIALLTCFIILIITKRTTSKLTKLVDTMEVATESNFKQQVPIDGGYEVRRLSTAYNQMVLELQSYIDKLMKEQEQRRVAELSALQMQINPHFMYNTLASIKYLAWQGDNNKVDEMINAFIALLQNTISKTDEMVTVQDEINNLKNYAKINSMRYGERIQVSYYIDEKALEVLIPKLLLQPLVENAFFHAFSNKQKGEIKIFISLFNDILTCEIIDNGDGINKISSEKTNFKTYCKSIGLDNTRQRLKLVYDDKAKLYVQSTPNIGTSVKIVIAVK